MYIAGIEENSVVDGPGVRLVLFMQGCPHDCEDCHNPQTHSLDGGEKKTVEDLAEDIMIALPEGEEHLTISGGEPFLQPYDLLSLITLLKRKGQTIKSVWCYTGYTWEELNAMHNFHIMALLTEIDVLVDGRFDKTKKVDGACYGSSNQRVIDVKETRMNGYICLVEESKDADDESV